MAHLPSHIPLTRSAPDVTYTTSSFPSAMWGFFFCHLLPGNFLLQLVTEYSRTSPYREGCAYSKRRQQWRNWLRPELIVMAMDTAVGCYCRARL